MGRHLQLAEAPLLPDPCKCDRPIPQSPGMSACLKCGRDLIPSAPVVDDTLNYLVLAKAVDRMAEYGTIYPRRVRRHGRRVGRDG